MRELSDEETEKIFSELFTNGKLVGELSAEEALQKGFTRNNLTPEELEKYYSEVENNNEVSDEEFEDWYFNVYKKTIRKNGD